MLWKCYKTKSKQTNQVFITMLNNDASRINTLESLDTLYTFYLAQFVSVPFFPPKRYLKKNAWKIELICIWTMESLEMFQQFSSSKRKRILLEALKCWLVKVFKSKWNRRRRNWKDKRKFGLNRNPRKMGLNTISQWEKGWLKVQEVIFTDFVS